jgi:spermidine synthase
VKLFNWRWSGPVADAGSVFVTEKHGVRSLHVGSHTIQSSMRLSRPNDLELAYTRSMMGFLLFNPAPRRVLMVGLGGGSLAKFVYHRLPETTVEVLEINPDVVAIARRYFQVPAGDDRLTVRVCDAAEFMEREGTGYDAILVDGYDDDEPPPSLSSRKFYLECRKRLDPGGVMAVNLWGSDRRFDEYVSRIESACPKATLRLPAEKPGNVVLFAFRDVLADPHWDELEARAVGLEAQYRLEFTRFVRGLKKMNRGDGERLYLSDPA